MWNTESDYPIFSVFYSLITSEVLQSLMKSLRDGLHWKISYICHYVYTFWAFQSQLKSNDVTWIKLNIVRDN